MHVRVRHEQRISPPLSVKPSALRRSTPQRVTNDCVVQRYCCSALSTAAFTLRETGSVDRLGGGGLPPAAILLKRYPYMPTRVCTLVLSSYYCPAFYPEAHKLSLINNCIPLLGELIDDTVPFCSYPGLSLIDGWLGPIYF